MRKILTIAGAAALALAFSLSAAAPSLADPAGDAAAAGVVGGIFGFMAGAAAASGGAVVVAPAPGFHHHHHFGAWEAHVAACQQDYGWRYNPDNDLVRLHGQYFQCDD